MQMARRNIENLELRQSQQLNALQGGYLKLNTVFSKNEYGGYFLIPYKRDTNSILMKIDIEDFEFFFEWDNKMLEMIYF